MLPTQTLTTEAPSNLPIPPSYVVTTQYNDHDILGTNEAL